MNRIIEETFLKGNNEVGDLLVCDIYGENSQNLGLPGKIIASSLGKLAKTENCKPSNYDITKSLVIAFAINIANNLALVTAKT
jgi:pantothenate kinase